MTVALPAGPFDLIFSCGSIPLRAAQSADGAVRAPQGPDAAGHHAHVVFTDRLVHEEKGEVVEYFTPGDLDESFVGWQTLRGRDHIISCAQDGTVHGHALEELVTAHPGWRAPWSSEQ